MTLNVSCSDSPSPPPVCPPKKPCSCTGIVNSAPPSTPTPSCPTGECLILCDIVLLAKDGVPPCGQAGILDVTAEIYKHKTDACENETIKWSLVDFEGPIISAKITTDGDLTWITGDSSTAGKYATVTLKACCGELSAYMAVVIGIKDLCNCPGCGDCELCDPCTGLCIDSEVELSALSIN